MEGIYLLPTGAIVQVYLYDDMLKPQTFEDREIETKFRNVIAIHYWEGRENVFKPRSNHDIIVDHIENGHTRKYEKINVQLNNDKVGLHFIVKDHVVYLKDFFAFELSELNERMMRGKPIRTDDFLASFMKHKDDVRFLYKMPVIEYAIPSAGICITGENVTWTVCRFVEKQYPSYKWGYKVEIEPVDKVMLRVVKSAETFYTFDFVSAIKSGRIRITSKLDRFNVLDEAEKTNVGKIEGKGTIVGPLVYSM